MRFPAMGAGTGKVQEPSKHLAGHHHNEVISESVTTSEG